MKNKFKTQHVRVSAEVHHHLKVLAAEKGISMLLLLDEICEGYLGKERVQQDEQML